MDYKLIIAIIVIALLIVIFIVSYLLNKKTPVPEGCNNLEINDDLCSSCNRIECSIKKEILEKLMDSEEK